MEKVKSKFDTSQCEAEDSVPRRRRQKRPGFNLLGHMEVRGQMRLERQAWADSGRLLLQDSVNTGQT